MLNQVVLVGRINKEIENNILSLAIPRSSKNENGEYETDFIDIYVSGNIAKSTSEYTKKGDIVGIKGRLERMPQINQKNLMVVAERVTFLSTRKEGE